LEEIVRARERLVKLTLLFRKDDGRIVALAGPVHEQILLAYGFPQINLLI
jgi:hypothetical protein